MIEQRTIIDPTATIPFIYEITVFIIGMVLLFLIIARYREKKADLTKILMISFLFYNAAILLSSFGKLLTMYYAGDFSGESVFIQELFGRIHALRIAFAFVGLGTLYSYKFETMVFEKKPNPTMQKLIFAFGLATIIFSLFVYSPELKSLNLPAFFLIFLLMVLIYFPFMFRSFATGMRVNEPEYKKAFFTLGFMSLFYILCFLCFIIDNIMLTLYQTRFSIFYYFGWSSVLMAIIMGYFGYIRPGSKKEKV